MPAKCHCGVYLRKLGGVRKNEKCIYIHIWMFLFHDDVIGAQRQKLPQYKYLQCSVMCHVKPHHDLTVRQETHMHLSHEREEKRKSCARQVTRWARSAAVTKLVQGV
jgi:hypothetical protein